MDSVQDPQDSMRGQEQHRNSPSSNESGNNQDEFYFDSHQPKLTWSLIPEQSTNAAQGQAGQAPQTTPCIKNHTATYYNKKLYIFGGYDGKKNHSALRVFDTEKDQWLKSKKTVGIQPYGRNGHTATLISKTQTVTWLRRESTVHNWRLARAGPAGCKRLARA